MMVAMMNFMRRPQNGSCLNDMDAARFPYST